MSRKELSPYLVEVNRVARLLMAEWARVEPKHAVTLYPTSYVATFADMAKVVVDDAIARGTVIPDTRHMYVRIKESLQKRPRRMRELGESLGITPLQTVAYRDLEDDVWDLLCGGKIRMAADLFMTWVEK